MPAVAQARRIGDNQATRTGRREMHMLMQEKNNAEIADVIQKWLTEKGMVE